MRTLAASQKYKNTPAGRIPVDWSSAAVGSLCGFSGGNGFRPADWADSGLPIIRIQNLNGSKNFNYYDKPPQPEWIVEPGDLLFAWAGVQGVSFGPTIWGGPRGLLNQHIYRVRPNEGVNKDWLFLTLQAVTAHIESKAHGFKSSLVHVRKSDIMNPVVPVPPLAEQQLISEAVYSWDSAIRSLGSLSENMIVLKRGVMQQLLAGKRRFGASTKTTWKTVKLSDVAERITRTNEIGCITVLTSSGEHGLVDQRDYFDRRVASDEVSHYLLLRKGEFAYNRSSSAGYPFGAIKRLDGYEQGVLSVLYLTFALRDATGIDSDFAAQYFESGALNRQLSRICEEGARAHGLLSVAASEFFSVKLDLPPLTEQRRIAALLKVCDDKIDLLKKQAEALREQKRGLMQKLLTGQIRLGHPTA